MSNHYQLHLSQAHADAVASFRRTRAQTYGAYAQTDGSAFRRHLRSIAAQASFSAAASRLAPAA